MTQCKLKKTEYDSLFSPDITIKEYNAIKEKICARLDYIVKKICRMNHNFWYDYDNGYGEKDGYFDEEQYKKYIRLEGDISLPEPFNDLVIPTAWLWEDFEEKFEKEVEQYKKEIELAKEKKKNRREQLKIRKQQLKEKIKKLVDDEMLTKDEAKLIKIK